MSFKIYSGTGTVFMRPVNESGVATGKFFGVGDAYPLTMRVATKKMEVKSRQVERAGQTIASKVEIDNIEGKLTLKEWNARNLAFGLSGAATERTGTSGSVADEAVTMPVPGEYAELTKRDIENVVVTSSPAGTTYTVDVDYVVDPKLGLITSVADGALDAGDVDTLVSFDYAAEAGYQVKVGSSVQVRVEILAHLYDEYRDKHYVMEIDSAVLATDSEINFISEEGSEGEPIVFNMSFETLSGQDSPARIDGVPV